MALEVEWARRPVRLSGPTPAAARGLLGAVAAGRLLAAYCANGLTHIKTSLTRDTVATIHASWRGSPSPDARSQQGSRASRCASR
jgi:hypothetical protein